MRLPCPALLLLAVLVCANNNQALAEGSGSGESAPSTLFESTPLPLRREINALYENPYTVEPGHFQMESYLIQYAHGESQSGRPRTSRETWTFGPVTLKAGLLNDLDAELIFTPYTHISFENTASGTKSSDGGFGNLVPRLKLNFWGDDGGATSLGMVPFIKIPTAARNLGNGSVEGGVILPLAVRLPRDWWMIVSQELDCFRDIRSNGYHVNWGSTIYLCHQIAGKLSGYADFVFSVSQEPGSQWLGIVDFGLSYAVTANSQIDLGLSIGVTSAVDQYNPYLGYSFRF